MQHHTAHVQRVARHPINIITALPPPQTVAVSPHGYATTAATTAPPPPVTAQQLTNGMPQAVTVTATMAGPANLMPPTQVHNNNNSTNSNSGNNRLPPNQQPPHHHQQQHAPAPMQQKVRQQHQHLNNNTNQSNNNNTSGTNNSGSNNSNNHVSGGGGTQYHSNSKGNYQQYNAQAAIMANMPPPQQQQQQQQQHPHRNYHQQSHHHQHMPPPPPPHHKNNGQNAISMQHHPANIVITTSAANNHNNSHVATQGVHPALMVRHATQQQAYYVPNNNSGISNSNHNHQYKHKYNNNNNNNNGGNNNNGNIYAPKAILQNPNRHGKVRGHASLQPSQQLQQPKPATSPQAENNDAVLLQQQHQQNGNNIAITPEPSETTTTPTVSGDSSAYVLETDVDTIESVVANCDETGDDIADITADDDNNNNNNNSSNQSADEHKILSNVDNSVARHNKEKTPMCLVNELARYNKITHQYRLTSEKGPAHCKRFTVTLKLGEEEYSAEGFKIKKAQHLAAADAIEKTKYKHPVPKVNRRSDEGNGGSSNGRVNITPTVELNALAMKLGQQTYYLFDPRQLPGMEMGGVGSGTPSPTHTAATTPEHLMAGGPGQLPLPPAPHMPVGGPPQPPHGGMYMRRAYMAATPVPPIATRFAARGYALKYGQQNPRFAMLPPMPSPHHAHHATHPLHGHPQHLHAPHMPFLAPSNTIYRITLIVGKLKFIGMGRTLQQAKHDAAARALQVLKAEANNQLNDMLNQSLDESDSKSPISVVHEIGIKRNLEVQFKVLREEGPAHMKNFVTACIVGTITTEGDGNGKKISKKRAAEKMLEELKKLPPLTPTKSPVKRIKVKSSNRAAAAAASGDAAAVDGGNTSGTVSSGSGRNERRKAAHKNKSDNSECSGALATADADADNPITKLIQLQQNRKEKEPIFELIAKNGNENSRRREFIIEVTAQGMVARGTGNSKKLAKRNAALNLLNTLIEAERSSMASAPQHTTTNSSLNSQANVNTPAVSTGIATTASAEAKPSNPTETVDSTAVDGKPSERPVADVPLVSTPAGQVPGILILRQNKKHSAKKKELISSSTTTATATILPADSADPNKATDTKTSTTTKCKENEKAATIATATTSTANNATATIAPTPSNNNTNTGSSSGTSTGVQMKDQLLYLAKLLSFEVNFSDYPKGNHNEFLTIVTLSTNPAQICHGVGVSSEESQNDAAKNALKILSELGLNSATK